MPDGGSCVGNKVLPGKGKVWSNWRNSPKTEDFEEGGTLGETE